MAQQVQVKSSVTMVMTIRTTGYMLIFLAVAALSFDVLFVLGGGGFELSTWGDLWHRIHPVSLNQYHEVVDNQFSPFLWDQVFAPLLLYKTVFVFAVPGLTLAASPGVFALIRKVFEG